MAGIDQDMIEVVVVGDDPGYLTFTLDFTTAELAALMRDAEDGEIELLEIEMESKIPTTARSNTPQGLLQHNYTDPHPQLGWAGCCCQYRLAAPSD